MLDVRLGAGAMTTLNDPLNREIVRLRKDLAVAREALQFIADWPDMPDGEYGLPVAVLAVARGALDKTEDGETTGNEREGPVG